MPNEYKTFSVRIPVTLWREATAAVRDHEVRGGLTAFVRDAMEGLLAQYRKLPLHFLVHFRRMNGGRDPAREEALACYGARWSADTTGIAANYFTLSELRDHFVNGTWDERTAELVREQRQIWKDRGEKLWQQPMFPPGWTTQEPQVALVEGKFTQEQLDSGELDLE